MLTAKHTWLTYLLRSLVAGGLLGLIGHATANECVNFFPDDVREDGLPHICQSDFNGISKTYSCQDYRSGETRYRVLYRGGLSPKAVIQFNPDGTRQLVSAPLFGDKQLTCPLKPPAVIPKHATHRGIGVCHDERNQQVACSVYEHAAARQTQAHRFMTFYTESGEIPVKVDTQVAGTNDDAMVAEIAFQIGMSLWDTECCVEQAVEYLAYAYQLFPRAEAYRQAYQRSRAIMALQEIK